MEEDKLATQIYCWSGKQLSGGRWWAMDYYEDEALNEAIDELIAQMTRVEPDLIKEEAREVIAGTVGHLLRDVGKVDPPFPRV
jgi:hypothetical protein